jgi:hypothetical protein
MSVSQDELPALAVRRTVRQKRARVGQRARRIRRACIEQSCWGDRRRETDSEGPKTNAPTEAEAFEWCWIRAADQPAPHCSLVERMDGALFRKHRAMNSGLLALFFCRHPRLPSARFG